MVKTRLEKPIARYERDEEFLVESLLIELGAQLAEAMRDANVTQSQLASRLGVSKSYISRVLNGTPNLTLKTLVRLANALNRRVRLQLVEVSVGQRSARVLALPDRMHGHGD